MKRCIACGAPLWETPLLTLDNMPASAQHLPDAQGVKEDRGLTLDLCQCMGCGLVQFDCEPVDYYRDVIRAGGFSKTMVELRRYQYKHLIDSYHLEGKKFIEVGCGQGEFLKVLSEFPVEVHGIEHDPHLVELARAQGLDVTEGFTDTEDTRFAGGLYDVFLSFNFLEHQPDPGTMLQAIYRNLEDDAMGLITVPSFEYIMDHNSYYELIRDHLAYYTFETLTPLLERNGFLVEECEVINRDTLSVIVKKRPQMDTENLLECYVNLKREMESYMKYLDAWDKKVAVWGASHQGFTLAATTKLGERARYIIDSAPFKQGKFAPASHLPIVGPDHFHEHPVDAIIITVPGYTDEIAASIRQKFGTSVEIRAMRSNHLEMV
ncbi:methyltransferase [Enterocloster clostridioformis]|uniref:class I SAM-dependent methyltransferase n=1 Tax=Enterocloster clostridioformis TaxID=1531 RepID=UPI00080C4454|nr:class I SAM-dependent methyltransferase [Enterocloster clostridioformis]ANU48068.1 methyltransferase [Lachnoclostridium sp. YL32]NDO29639.1 class I SAM-dependent methyltransferase [Enterocloster clostridioformis]OXE69220.1 methyltransferase [Enterocloster clostridioformis]QQR03039.1 methyltransferase domain-containing protein [Enterocloster clostridioformis]